MNRSIQDMSFFLKNFNLDQLYWYLEFGPSKRKISPDELKKNLHEIDRPVFFLSTGRTGTKWFADLLSADRKMKAIHAPAPDLAAQNIFAYQLQKGQKYQEERLNDILSQIFLAGRETYLRYSYKCERRYVETNNHITFFAHAIAKLLPQSMFIHIHRHPGDFVSSGLKRNWYREEGEEIRQITPVEGHHREDWSGYHIIQKIGWLWNETNSYIESFKKSLPPERIFTFDFSSMDLDSLTEMMQFAGAGIYAKHIRKKMKRRLNFQQFQTSEKYASWTDAEKQMLIDICQPLADKYQYKF